MRLSVVAVLAVVTVLAPGLAAAQPGKASRTSADAMKAKLDQGAKVLLTGSIPGAIHTTASFCALNDWNAKGYTVQPIR